MTTPQSSTEDERDQTLLDILSNGANGHSYADIVKQQADDPCDYHEWTVRNVDELYEAISAYTEQRVLEAQIKECQMVMRIIERQKSSDPQVSTDYLLGVLTQYIADLKNSVAPDSEVV